ncbi:Ribonuclease Z [Marinobacterium lacunae]|uniref:Ribonuclease Z n=1 Tax=Marinobacterium lacunae TaxID=1232683 RepID=A0A081G2W5_9GAMM|nr:ribonuclease Z [Marinobacterium lacunae]KEA65120.1 Ribonuclease Z [Marinobacterium lacunae]MBR9884879.1 MBL fold metallo-hydrolase [Oceanospirillales bacterium]
MKITFLGTSSGAPTRHRNVSATAVQPERGKPWVLIDCGEATQHQLLRTRLSPLQLSAILITHVHGDHCYGLPGLLASCQLNGRKAPLTLVGPHAIWRYLQAVIECTEMRIDYPIEFIPVDGTLDLEAAGFRIQACALSHRTECWAYRLEECEIPLQLDVQRLKDEGVSPGPEYAQLQQGRDLQLPDGRWLRSADYTRPSRAPRVAVIAGDNDSPERLTGLCADAALLVHEATYTADVLEQVGPEPQHSCAAQVARFAESRGIPNLILTHFSPRYLRKARRRGDRQISEIKTEARTHYSGQLQLAEDFACWLISRDGLLLPL